MSAPVVRRRENFFAPIPDNGRLVSRGTRWGNPYQVNADGTRVEVVAAYERDLYAGRLRVTVEDVRRELRGFDLYCYCAPELCHADVLLEVANS